MKTSLNIAFGLFGIFALVMLAGFGTETVRVYSTPPTTFTRTPAQAAAYAALPVCSNETPPPGPDGAPRFSQADQWLFAAPGHEPCRRED